jgi:hypothetical protein
MLRRDQGHVPPLHLIVRLEAEEKVRKIDLKL